MDTQEELQAVGALTKLSNEAAQLGVQLINANKENLKTAKPETVIHVMPVPTASSAEDWEQQAARVHESNLQNRS
jgi:hypothetical protein